MPKIMKGGRQSLLNSMPADIEDQKKTELVNMEEINVDEENAALNNPEEAGACKADDR